MNENRPGLIALSARIASICIVLGWPFFGLAGESSSPEIAGQIRELYENVERTLGTDSIPRSLLGQPILDMPLGPSTSPPSDPEAALLSHLNEVEKGWLQFQELQNLLRLALSDSPLLPSQLNSFRHFEKNYVSLHTELSRRLHEVRSDASARREVALSSSIEQLGDLVDQVLDIEQGFQKDPQAAQTLAELERLRERYGKVLAQYLHHAQLSPAQAQAQLIEYQSAFQSQLDRVLERVEGYARIEASAAELAKALPEARKNVTNLYSFSLYAGTLRDYMRALEQLQSEAPLSATKLRALEKSRLLLAQAEIDLQRLRTIIQIVSILRDDAAESIHQVYYLSSVLEERWPSLNVHENLAYQAGLDAFGKEARKTVGELENYLLGLKWGDSKLIYWNGRKLDLAFLNFKLAWLTRWATRMEDSHWLAEISRLSDRAKSLHESYLRLEKRVSEGDLLVLRFASLIHNPKNAFYELFSLRKETRAYIQALRNDGFSTAAREVEEGFYRNMIAPWASGQLLDTCSLSLVTGHATGAVATQFLPRSREDAALPLSITADFSAPPREMARFADALSTFDLETGGELTSQLRRTFAPLNRESYGLLGFFQGDKEAYQHTNRMLDRLFDFRRDETDGRRSNRDQTQALFTEHYLGHLLRHFFSNYLVLRVFHSANLDLTDSNFYESELKRFLGVDSNGKIRFLDRGRSRRGKPVYSEIRWSDIRSKLSLKTVWEGKFYTQDRSLLLRLQNAFRDFWKSQQNDIRNPHTPAEFSRRKVAEYFQRVAKLNERIYPLDVNALQSWDELDLSAFGFQVQEEIRNSIREIQDLAKMMGPLLAFGEVAPRAMTAQSVDRLREEAFYKQLTSWLNLFHASSEKPDQFIAATTKMTPEYFFDVAKSKPAYIAMACDADLRAYQQLENDELWSNIMDGIKSNLATGALILSGVTMAVTGLGALAPSALMLSSLAHVSATGAAVFGVAEVASIGTSLAITRNHLSSYQAISGIDESVLDAVGEHAATTLGITARGKVRELSARESDQVFELAVSSIFVVPDVADIASTLRRLRTSSGDNLMRPGTEPAASFPSQAARQANQAPRAEIPRADPLNPAVSPVPLPRTPRNASTDVPNPHTSSPQGWRERYQFPGVRSQVDGALEAQLRHSLRRLADDLLVNPDAWDDSVGHLLRQLVDEPGAAVRQVDPNDINRMVLERQLRNPDVSDFDFHISADPRFPAVEILPHEAVTFFRVSGGDSAARGGFLLPMDPSKLAELSEDQFRHLFSIPPGNTTLQITQVTLPAGSRFTLSRAAPNAFGRGGGLQITIDPSMAGVRWGEPQQFQFHVGTGAEGAARARE